MDYNWIEWGQILKILLPSSQSHISDNVGPYKVRRYWGIGVAVMACDDHVVALVVGLLVHWKLVGTLWGAM